MVDNSWKRNSLESLLELIIDNRGKSVPKSKSGIRLITAKNIRSGYLDFSSQEYVDESAFKDWMKRGQPIKNDILFTTEAPLGNVCLFPDDGLFAIGQRMVVLRTNDIVDSVFLFFVLLSEQIQHKINICSTGSTAKGIKTSELKKIIISYPCLISEQQKIAKILSTWDQAIEKTEKLIEQSKLQKKALMQQLLTGKKRLVNPETGKVFEGEWKQLSLSAISAEGKESFIDGDWVESPHISEKGYRLIQTGNIGVGFFKNKTKKYIFESSFHSLKCKEVKINDLLICRLAEPAGRACVVPELHEEKMITSVDVTIMRVDELKSLPEYLSYYLSLEKTLHKVSTLCGGSTRSRISRSNLGKLKISLPSTNEQKKIVSVLLAADREIELLEQKRARFIDEKKALMQQLLTGKKRVKLDKAQAA